MVCWRIALEWEKDAIDGLYAKATLLYLFYTGCPMTDPVNLKCELKFILEKCNSRFFNDESFSDYLIEMKKDKCTLFASALSRLELAKRLEMEQKCK